MKLAIIPLLPAQRSYIRVLRIRAAMFGLVLLSISIAGDYLFDHPLRWFPTALALLWCGWAIGIAPRRRWASMGHLYTGEELHRADGLLIRTFSIVPVSRVQSVDIVEGPVERLFGLAALVLRTAGHDENAVTVSGLTRDTAQEILLSVREKIGSAKP